MVMPFRIIIATLEVVAYSSVNRREGRRTTEGEDEPTYSPVLNEDLECARI